MYKLRKYNVVKTVDSARKRDELLAKGFELVVEEKKPAAKAKTEAGDT